MATIYVCTQCGEEYSAPGICEACQIDLVPSDEENEEEYGFHEEGGEDEEEEDDEDAVDEIDDLDEEADIDEEEVDDFGALASDDDEENL